MKDVFLHDIIGMLSHLIRQRKGGVPMSDFAVSVLIAVVGGVACHYIIKWLDSRSSDN